MSADGSEDTPATRLAHLGNDPAANHGVVNPPVYRASTILFPTLDAYEHAEKTPYEGTRYGRRGTPTTFALEDAVAALEGGYRSIAVPSGLAAITCTLIAYLRAGDHLLMADTTYGPGRRFCDTVLAGFGVETTYYDPLADVTPLIRKHASILGYVNDELFELGEDAWRPGVDHVEGTVKAVVGPVYDRCHGVPLDLLKFLDRKVRLIRFLDIIAMLSQIEGVVVFGMQ